MDAFEINTSRDLSTSKKDNGYGPGREEMDPLPEFPQAIKTKGVFSMMDLPAELRLKVWIPLFKRRRKVLPLFEESKRVDARNRVCYKRSWLTPYRSILIS
jgi:hypothetical protein